MMPFIAARNAAISCYQRKKPQLFLLHPYFPLISLLLFNSSSAFSVWPFFYCAELLHSAGSCYSVCKAAEGWRFYYSKALLMLCIVHGSAVQSLILSHCSLPPLGEVLLQDAYRLGLSCWEPEASQIFLNLLSQLQQQKHLTSLSKSIQGFFLFWVFFFLKDICLHNCFTAKLFKSTSRGRDVGWLWL